MIKININLPIAPESENRWMAMWGEENVAFSLETIKKIFDENPDENEYTLNFDCVGGYVEEGFKIYDYLRTSGKNLHCNIEGGCHSMATVLLLAAPKNQRTANKHATSLIHCVRSVVCDSLTTEELRKIAEENEEYENKILDIYADRTGVDIETLRALMHEEKERDTDFLIEHGFIDHVNPYNTNSKAGSRQNNNYKPQNSNNMSKLQEALNKASELLKAATNLLGGQQNQNEPASYQHKDAEGNVMFTTNVADDMIEVGMSATPDGTYTLQDNRIVDIADGVITNIREAQSVPEPDERDAKIAEMQTQIDNLTAQNTELQNSIAQMTTQMDEYKQTLTEATAVIDELKTLSSDYQPKNAKRTAPATTSTNEETVEEHRENMRKKLGLNK